MNKQQLLLMLSAKLIELASAQTEEQEHEIQKEIFNLNEQINSVKPDKREEEIKSVFLKLTNKEISRMPTRFRKILKLQGCLIHCRKRKSGSNINYELRYRRDGYNVCVSSNNLEEAKNKFIEKINSIESKTEETANIPTTFKSFTMFYFEKYRIRKVTEKTYKIDLNRLKNHVFPYFKEIKLNKITPNQCQDLLDKLEEKGINKTKQDIYSLLNCIFKCAIAHGIITKNPMEIVIINKYDKKHGKALTKEEEKHLLEVTKGTPYNTMYAIALYTGIRPNEYSSVKIEEKFIVAINSKRKNKKIEYKKIPITKMLRPYLEGINSITFYSEDTMRDKFNSIFENHILYDLRTTFYTRCQECGIAEVAIKKYVGHSLGGLANTYTDLSDEYLLKEAEKFEY